MQRAQWNQLSKLAYLPGLIMLVWLAWSCSSTAGQTKESQIQNQKSNAAAHPETLENLKILKLSLDVWNKAAALRIELGIIPDAVLELSVLPIQDYRIQISAKRLPDKILLDQILRVNKDTNSLILPTLAGLNCAEIYILTVSTKLPKGSIKASSELQFADPFLADPSANPQTVRPPILIADNLIQGQILIPALANNPQVELLDSQGNRLTEVKPPLPKIGDQITKTTLPSASIEINFNCKADLTATNPHAQIRYRFAYPSQILSDWHPGQRYQLAAASPLQIDFPADNSETLSRNTRFEWQAISSSGEYVLNISPIDPASAAFSIEVQKTLKTTTNTLIIDLITLLPTLKTGMLFYWQVGYSIGQMISPWHKARFTTDLDDELIVLPPGTSQSFAMGDAQIGPDTSPVHQVVLNTPFALARSPLTNSTCAELLNRRIQRGLARLENQQIIDASSGNILFGLSNLGYGQQFGISIGPGGSLVPLPGRGQHPAVGISWFGAVAICQEADYLMGQKSITWRLPTEAEWEYAASAGGSGPSPWGTAVQAGLVNFMRSRDVYEDLSPPYTRKGGPTVPIRFYEKNRLAQAKSQAAFRELDMLGNVWEWCSDWYDPIYYAKSSGPIPEPQGPAEISVERIRELDSIGQLPSRVVRGGAWNSIKEEVSPRNRGKFPPGQTSFSIGLRLARTIR